MVEQTPTERIRQRRRQLLVHQILYYVFDSNLVSDQQYDRWNRELVQLEQQYPAESSQVEYANISPSIHVGSSDASTYPPELVKTAEMLLKNRRNV